MIMGVPTYLAARDLRAALDALSPDNAAPVVVRGKGPGVIMVKTEDVSEYDNSMEDGVRRTQHLVIIAEG